MSFFTQTEFKTYIRNFIFGVEDSLVSTVGLLSGIAAANVATSTIMLTGIVLIFVEAVSMGIGSYLSENAISDNQNFSAHDSQISFVAGGIMFFSYLAAGLIPLLPYLILERPLAFWLSIICSLLALFGLGAFSAALLRTKIWRNAFKMFLLGGLAIAIGVLVGKFIETKF